jgi:hypothetical protein
MERVQCIGSEHEKMMHYVIMFNLKMIKLFKMRQTNTDWENKTYSFSDLMENISEGDVTQKREPMSSFIIEHENVHEMISLHLKQIRNYVAHSIRIHPKHFKIF